MARDRASEAAVPWADLDRVPHDPARLAILGQRSCVAEAAIPYFQRRTGLTKGNLSSQPSKRDDDGSVAVTKTFVGKVPRMHLAPIGRGRAAFTRYRARSRELVEGSGG